MRWIDNGYYGINPPIPTLRCSSCNSILNENVLKLDHCPVCNESVDYKNKIKRRKIIIPG